MSLRNALSYLTVLPIPFKKDLPLNRSVHFFPLVGAVMGSILVLSLLAFKTILPQFLACIATIGVLEAMTGGIHLRAFAELWDGRRTFPGSGFASKTDYGWKGAVAVGLLLLVKVASLAHMRGEWQSFAVLIAPILGRSSQCLGIIFSRNRMELSYAKPDLAVKRRQIRALVFTGLLLASMALFPWRVAGGLVVEYFVIIVTAFRFLNGRNQGLTVQALGAVAEFAEAGFLATCAALS